MDFNVRMDQCTFMVGPEIQKHDDEGAVLLGRPSSELKPTFSAVLNHYLSALGRAKLKAATILDVC